MLKSVSNKKAKKMTNSKDSSKNSMETQKSKQNLALIFRQLDYNGAKKQQLNKVESISFLPTFHSSQRSSSKKFRYTSCKDLFPQFFRRRNLMLTCNMLSH